MAKTSEDGVSQKGNSNEILPPTITEEDLKEFHRKHIPTTSLPKQFFFVDNHDGDVFNGQDDEDDALGYYPDGVKRTLTDAQIAIFRHSEIQRLLRDGPEAASPGNIQEKKLSKKERWKKKIKAKKDIARKIAQAPYFTPQVPVPGPPSYGIWNADDARFSSKSTVPAKRRNSSSPELESEAEVIKAEVKKLEVTKPEAKKARSVSRKRSEKSVEKEEPRYDPEDFKPKGEDFTFRRLARDADEIKTVPLELDY